MDKKIINIKPKLIKKHQVEFLEFCKKIRKSIRGKNTSDRTAILSLEKESINAMYSGKKFHANTDIAFMKNLIVDLLLQDWELVVSKDNIQIEFTILDEGTKNLDLEKAKTRRRHLLARDVQLKETSVQEFVRSMEKRRLTERGWHSIFSVMRDGKLLSPLLAELRKIPSEENRIRELGNVVKPYIQFVEPGVKCAQTGLPLSDIWRYFRHTWINEYKSLPGRSISILIRDAGENNHPIIGIAALGSSVAQQSVRDEWIGWDGETFIYRLTANPSGKIAKWIVGTLDKLFSEIYLKDFFKEKIISLSDIKNPTPEKIKELKEFSIKAKNKHINNPESAKFISGEQNINWVNRAETNLFKSKRAQLLAELLGIRLVFNKYQFVKGGKKELENNLRKPDFCDAIQKLARKAKAIHVGINMMDIIVCGAVAPYNHILGGKLVCMLLTSPEIIKYYHEKYGTAVSLIASSMSGKAVVRNPQLVYLGTTSLYGGGSSQYNRIKLPAGKIGGSTNRIIEYKELGLSEGYGSFHFSGTTIALADAVAGREKGRSRVNSIFGEGANPLIRKLKDAMEYLDLDSNPILNHRNKRVVYGIALADNFGDVLLGLAKKAKYILPQSNPSLRSELISKFWIERWLINRIKDDSVLEKVSNHSLAYPISHGAKVPLMTEEFENNFFEYEKNATLQN